MDKLAATVEDVFNRALEFPPGAARDHFVSGRCAHDTRLRREVESLLHAHEAAGGFLLASDEQKKRSAQPAATAPKHATATMNAAAHAEIFLRGAGDQSGKQVHAFIATLPEAIRQEVSERIEAGLHIRQFRTRAEPPAAPVEEPAPALPGFRIERKLGEGSLGVVYAAHDEKLNRRVAVKVLRRRADEQVRRRVLNEARKAAALNDPPWSRFSRCSTKPIRRPS